MRNKEDSNTRYFVDLDLDAQTVLNWDYGQKDKLAQKLKNPYHHRLFISKGQYNKLEKKSQELRNRI